MRTISIKLPDDLLGRSTRLAKTLSMTRSDLVRRALEREIRLQEKRMIQQKLREAANALNATGLTKEPWAELDTDLGIEEETPWWETP
ncbi:MAG TPA: ribbon-helix-helix protein, CopG family [Gammaproteobacteria bacterium]|nr:ribbon-helix-helix protein, CopG family [Gammaproteobacteria bacterium]